MSNAISGKNKKIFQICCRLFYLKSLGKSVSYIRGVWLVLLLSCFVEISEINANRLDLDQTPRSAASDLGLSCFSMSHLWDARLKWVKK